MMLAELTLLLDALPAAASLDQYESAILDANILFKRTVSNRRKTFRFLRELYALDPADPVFSVMRFLWSMERAPGGRALLALLAAAFGDELLRPTARAVLASNTGDRLCKDTMAHALADTYPGRFGENSLAKLGRNIASTWTQSGHLVGHIDKRRAPVQVTTATTAFATFLGWLQGERGLNLLTSQWALLLDADAGTLDSHLFAASQRGWLTYKRMNDVVEIGCSELLALTKQYQDGSNDVGAAGRIGGYGVV